MHFSMFLMFVKCFITIIIQQPFLCSTQLIPAARHFSFLINHQHMHSSLQILLKPSKWTRVMVANNENRRIQSSPWIIWTLYFTERFSWWQLRMGRPKVWSRPCRNMASMSLECTWNAHQFAHGRMRTVAWLIAEQTGWLHEPNFNAQDCDNRSRSWVFIFAQVPLWT